MRIANHEPRVKRGGVNEIQKKVLEFKNKSRPLFHQPLWLTKLGGDFLSLVMSNPPISREAVDFIMMDNPTDPKPAEKIFEIKVRNLSEGLKAYK